MSCGRGLSAGVRDKNAPTICSHTSSRFFSSSSFATPRRNSFVSALMRCFNSSDALLLVNLSSIRARVDLIKSMSAV